MRIDRTSLAIGAMTVTAIALLVRLFAAPSPGSAVWASGMSASGGDFVISVGGSSDRDEELVYVVDNSTEKMAVYRFDTAKRTIEPVQQLDLADMRRKADTPAPATRGK